MIMSGNAPIAKIRIYMCMIISDLFFRNRKSFEAHWLFLRANIYLPNLSTLLKTYKRVITKLYICILWVTVVLLLVSHYTFNSQNLTSNSPFWLLSFPYTLFKRIESYNQDHILQPIHLLILVTCLQDNVLILQGKVICRSLLRVKGLTFNAKLIQKEFVFSFLVGNFFTAI